MTLRSDLPYVFTPQDLRNSQNPDVQKLVKKNFISSSDNNEARGLFELNAALGRGLMLKGKGQQEAKRYPNGIDLAEFKQLFPDHWCFILTHMSQEISCVENLHQNVLEWPECYTRAFPFSPGDKLDLSKNLPKPVAAVLNDKVLCLDETSNKVFYKVNYNSVLLGSKATLNEEGQWKMQEFKCAVNSEAEVTQDGFKFITFSTNAHLLTALWMGNQYAIKGYYVNPPEQTAWSLKGVIGSIVGLFRRVFSRSSDVETSQVQPAVAKAISGNSNASIIRSLPSANSLSAATKVTKQAPSSRWDRFSQLFQSAVVSGNTEATNIFDSFDCDRDGHNQLRR